MVICEKKLCSGCSACQYVCPQNAISMKGDSEGFLRPEIDGERCTRCGLCEKKCPVNKTENILPLSAYAAYAKDSEVRKNSSSGGIFYTIAASVIGDGGVVFGAGYGEGMKVVHKCATDLGELRELCGSKYVQSDLEGIYEKLSESLGEKRKTLFVGTPCQCAAVRGMFRDDENLILADFICHGVPTPALWKKYVSEEFPDAHSASFRDKKRGWEEFSLRVDTEKGSYNASRYKDPYLRMFLKNVALRPSCHSCSWKGEKHSSDITLADFWGISKAIPAMNDDKGVSLVIVRSKKGEALFASISPELVTKKTDLEPSLRGNGMYVSSAHEPKQREEFFKKLSGGESFKALAAQYGTPLNGKELFKIRTRTKIKKLLGKVYRLKNN